MKVIKLVIRTRTNTNINLVTVNESTPVVDTSSGVVPSTVNQIIPILPPSDAANKKLLRNGMLEKNDEIFYVNNSNVFI